MNIRLTRPLLSLALLAALAACESVAGRELAACGDDAACKAAVNARWQAWADNYSRTLFSGGGGVAPVQQLGLQMANPQSQRRPALSCYNTGGIVNCY